MPDLTRGANASISGTSLQVAVSGARQGAVDLMVFQVGETGKVRSDADFVFFNQPASPEGAVRLTAADSLTVDLTGIPEAIDKLAVAVALDDSVAGSLAGIAGLGVSVTGSSDQHVAPAAGMTSERAAVLVEIYRRAGSWKVRNVSAGWTEGLSGLAKEHGVSVDDEPAAVPPAASAPPASGPPAGSSQPPAQNFPPPAAPSAPQPAPPAAPPPAADGVRSVPGEAGLSLVKRQKLDLRKREVAKVLLTKGAQNERARIVLVLDKTGSMSDEYAAGIVHRVVERMVPVAIQLDDDGSLECYLYAVKFAKLPDIRIEYLDQWMADFIHMTGTHQGINYRDIGGYNDEIPIMNEVINSLQGQTGPTLVLFFTDGGFTKKKEITNLMKKASNLPAFWQFVGIGNNNFGVLTKLDEMTGRVVDNVGFFPVTDIDRIDDGELYRRLLSEFPDWLRAARGAGILR
ncbi:stress response protein SCP2 [Nakamurella sp. UYEF19]|uniref:vWA domain-containing protein n=1 Tax=Nakamurella sp. UYEF19 TaxID=1756392 RepID=UPI003392D628